MLSKPLHNALLAATYIWCIALFFRAMEFFFKDTPDPFFAPVIALSLLVFSVALMGFLFFYQPVVLILEHKHKEAGMYFLTTLLFFGGLTLVTITFMSIVVLIE